MIAPVQLLAFIALPVASGLVGAAMGEMLPISRRGLGVALHVATGVIVAVVSVELLPRTLLIGPPILVILAFVIGGLFFIFLDSVTEIASSMGGGKRTARRAQRATGGPTHGHWVLAIGMGVNLVTDGMMITVGTALSAGLGLMLALGATVVEFPQAFAAAAVLKEQRVPPSWRWVTLALLLLALPVGAIVGFLLVGGPVVWQVFTLAFTAGMLATLMIEEMTPQAHVCEEGRLATVGFLFGFAMFALLGVFVG